MKKRLIYSALLVTGIVTMSSCGDDKSSAPQQAAAGQTQASESDAGADAAQEAAAVQPPTQEEITALFTERFSNLPFLKVEGAEVQSTPRGDGGLQLTVKLTLNVAENLYSKQQSPAEFSEGRKVVQAIHNDAVRPDSAYLLNMGAESSMLTEQDKLPKSLPDNLQQMYTELVNLSESYCYAQKYAADTKFDIEYNLDAVKNADKWEFSNIVEKEDLITPLTYMTPQSALPEGAPVITDEFVRNRNEEIKNKAEAFITATEEYLKSREEPLRAELVTRQAVQAEEVRKAEEAAKAEAERAAEQQNWNDFCISTFAADSKFSGEWTRDSRFGELTLKVDNATIFENAIHFYGTIYDTKLPQASISISGRCSMVRDENGVSKVDVTLYDGAYDPDEPTAEVYDAADGRLILTVGKDGVLSGVMTCASWAEAPERSFAVRLTLQPKKKND